MVTVLTKAYHEVGLKAFVESPRDVKVLCLQRFVRLAAYGASTLILVLYLVDLGNTVDKTGLFMTLTLVGDVVISLILTLVADKLGRRRLLAVGSLLMAASGVVFAITGNFWILLLASMVGVISPSGNEIGPFKAIEESIVSQLTPSMDRSSMLAWYTLHGTAGVAVGTISCGWVVRVLQNKNDWEPVQTYRLIYAAYAAMGILKFCMCLALSKACELEPPKTPSHPDNDERQPLLANGHDERQPGRESQKSMVRSLQPSLSTETRSLILKLGVLFAMDSLASGLSPASWVIYFFHSKFGLEENKLGSLFFVTNIVSSASNLVASSLARRIGLVKTMVFTHAPASIALALLPVPGNVVIAMALLLFRASTNSMDQAPRQAFLAAAVLPAERTSVMGIINVIKTMSQSVGPVITGRLAGSGKFWVAFVLAGYQTVEDKAQATVIEEEGREREEGTDGRQETS
ncbi:hypothetical protein LTR70_000004 [Exophiala xenobiotica]|uniref:Major facilitator superfamily (MFS) profile domain-containing protein n=1 Tax=Lithohypha guttulata TaxID=1690604 RepID=A0ABR0K4H7_9EURO|nr:hypothetical protein LTR24_006936 [Lithohypha guttulata]KAK5330682.1 hypothetical protein LTR70_000004 [Exophiala xenobiotica]